MKHYILFDNKKKFSLKITAIFSVLNKIHVFYQNFYYPQIDETFFLLHNFQFLASFLFSFFKKFKIIKKKTESKIEKLKKKHKNASLRSKQF